MMLVFHFMTRVVPMLSASGPAFEAQRVLPYVLLAAAVVYLIQFAREREQGYREFITNSPGAPINTEGIVYGVGHGFRGNDEIESPSTPRQSGPPDA